MPGFDPAFVARTADAWFGPDEQAARWRDWWRQPPVTPEKEAAYGELVALERDLTAGGAEPDDWPPRLRRVSEALLRALTTDFSEDSGAMTSGAAAWLAALNRLLGHGRVPMRWGNVFPGQRFDPDAMEAIDSLSGNRLIVHQPLSWVVRDLSGPKARVALRARVITA
jgi:hypothetical protein